MAGLSLFLGGQSPEQDFFRPQSGQQRFTAGSSRSSQSAVPQGRLPGPLSTADRVFLSRRLTTAVSSIQVFPSHCVNLSTHLVLYPPLKKIYEHFTALQ